MARRPRQVPAEGKPAKDLGPLRMIWRETLKYPRQVTIALLALVVSSAATLAIPWRFKAIIDRADFQSKLRAKAGHPVTLTIVRNGETIQRVVRLGAMTNAG